MKVLFLTDSLSDLDGVGRYALRLISAMEQLRPGLEVHVLLARKHRPTSKDVPAHWRVEVGLPPDYFYYMSPLRFAASQVQGVWNTWRAARGATIIHAIKDFPHNLVALQAARLRGIPCVATGHGTYTVQPLLDDRHRARALRTYAGIDGMISVSRYTAGRVRGLIDDEAIPRRLVVVPNSVSAAHYAEAREIGHRPWHDVPFTIAIGELKERKGHHLWIEALCGLADRWPDLHHYLVGRGSDDAYHRGLLARLEAAGLADRVHLLGNIDEDEKVDLLQRAQLFVHTPVTASDGGFEGFGIVYLEASASGTPVLGTRECGAEDAIVDGETGLLVEPNVAAVRAGLERLLDDGALRERMGAAGRKYAAGTTWSDNAARVLALYDEVLGERRGEHPDERRPGGGA